jgi:hypothetical protein
MENEGVPMSFVFLLIVSCYLEDDPGCLEPNLRLWCTDEMALEDRAEPPCDEPTGEPSFRCGPYDVVSTPPDYSGTVHYFDHDSGKHVATRYWTDVNTQCGGFDSWYGRRIDCSPTCSYVEDQYSVEPLPLCD